MNAHRNFPRQQQGVALIVGLMLLLVLTIISLSALKNTTRQQLMTTNSELSIRTFAAAESAIRDVFNEVRFLRAPPGADGYVLTEAISAAENGTAPPAREINNLDELTVTSNLVYLGTSPAPGNSLNIGTGQGFVLHRFVINGQATLGEATDPLSRSWHQQGLAQLGPG